LWGGEKQRDMVLKKGRVWVSVVERGEEKKEMVSLALQTHICGVLLGVVDMVEVIELGFFV